MRQVQFQFHPPIGTSLALWADGSWYLFFPDSSIDEVEKFLAESLARFQREADVIRKALAKQAARPGCAHPPEKRVTNLGEVTCLGCNTMLFKIAEVSETEPLVIGKKDQIPPEQTASAVNIPLESSPATPRNIGLWEGRCQSTNPLTGSQCCENDGHEGQHINGKGAQVW